MLDFSHDIEIEAPITEIPANFMAAMADQPQETLELIEADIEFFEQTGILKGRAMTLIKALMDESKEVSKPRRPRPTLLVA